MERRLQELLSTRRVVIVLARQLTSCRMLSGDNEEMQ